LPPTIKPTVARVSRKIGDGGFATPRTKAALAMVFFATAVFTN
jgi:hypothetical protein